MVVTGMDASTRRQILTRAARAGAAVALLDPWTARAAGAADRSSAGGGGPAGRREGGDPARGPGAARDRRTAAELLADLSPLARFLAAADLRDDFTVEPRRLSLLSLAWSYAVSESQSD